MGQCCSTPKEDAKAAAAEEKALELELQRAVEAGEKELQAAMTRERHESIELFGRQSPALGVVAREGAMRKASSTPSSDLPSDMLSDDDEPAGVTLVEAAEEEEPSAPEWAPLLPLQFGFAVDGPAYQDVRVGAAVRIVFVGDGPAAATLPAEVADELRGDVAALGLSVFAVACATQEEADALQPSFCIPLDGATKDAVVADLGAKMATAQSGPVPVGLVAWERRMHLACFEAMGAAPGAASPSPRLLSYLEDGSGDGHVCLVHGMNRARVSSTVAATCSEWRSEHGASDVHVLVHSVPCSQTTDVRHALYQLCRELRDLGIKPEHADSSADIPQDLDKLVDLFPEMLAAAAAGQRRLLVVFDRVDLLSDIFRAHSMSWLPRTVPESVRLVVTSASGHPCQRVMNSWPTVARVDMRSDRERRATQGSTHRPSVVDLTDVKIGEDGDDAAAAAAVAEEEERAEQDADAHTARLELALDSFLSSCTDAEAVVAVLAAARGGLTEPELAEVVGAQAARVAVFEHAAALAALLQSPWRDLLVLEPEIAVMVQLRLGSATIKAARGKLVDFYRRAVSLASGPHFVRSMRALVYQLCLSQAWEPLGELLTDLSYLQTKIRLGLGLDLAFEYAEVLRHVRKASVPDTDLDERALTDFERFILQGLSVFAKHPGLVYQDAFNQPPMSAVHRRALGLVPRYRATDAAARGTWVEHVNRRRYGAVCTATLRAHADTVTCVAVSHDGGVVASGGCEGEVHLWDGHEGTHAGILSTSQEATQLGHYPEISALALSGSAQRLAAGNRSGALVLWDLDELVPIMTDLKSHDELKIRHIAFSKDESSLVSAGEDGTYQVWSADDGAKQCTIRALGNEEPMFCTFVGGGHERFAVSQMWGQNCLIHDAGTGRLLSKFQVRPTPYEGDESTGTLAKADLADDDDDDDADVRMGSVGCGTFFFQGADATEPSLVVYGETDGGADGTHMVAVYVLRRDKHGRGRLREAQRMLRHEKPVRSVCLDPDAHRVASGSDDGTIAVWSVRSGAKVDVLRGHGAGVTSLAWSADGRYLVSGSAEKTVRIWDAKQLGAAAALPVALRRSRSLVPPRDAAAAAASSKKSFSVGSRVEDFAACAVLPGGSEVAGVVGDVVARWSTESCQVLDQTEIRYVRSIAYSLDGRYLAWASPECAYLWDRMDRCALAKARRLDNHDNDCERVAFSPDSELLVTGGGDSVTIFHCADGSVAHQLLDLGSQVMSCAISGSRVCAGMAMGAVRQWRLSDWKSVLTLELDGVVQGHGTGVGTVRGARPVALPEDAVAPMGGSGDDDDDEQRPEFGRVLDCAYTLDGRLLVVAFEENLVAALDAATGKEVKRLEPHENYHVTKVSSCPNGRMVATVGLDGAIKVHDTQTWEVLATLHSFDEMSCCAFFPDGSRLLAGTRRHTMEIRDVDALLEMRSKDRETLQRHRDRVTSIDWRPVAGTYGTATRSMFVTASADGSARVWRTSATSCEVVRTLSSNDKGGVHLARYSEDGQELLTLTSREASRWGARDFDRVETLATLESKQMGGEAEMAGGIGSKSGMDLVRFATEPGPGARGSGLPETRTSSDIVCVQEHAVALYRIDFVGPPARLVGSVRLKGRLSTSGYRLSKTLNRSVGINQLKAAGLAGRYSVAVSPSGTLVAISGEGGRVEVRKCVELERKHAVIDVGDVDAVLALAWWPDSTQLAVGDTSGSIAVYKCDGGDALWRVDHAHSDLVTCMAVDANGQVVVSAGRDSYLRAWDPATGQMQARFFMSGGAETVKFGPVGQQLVVGDANGIVYYLRVWS